MSDYRCHFFLYRLFGISGSVPGRGLALVLLSNLSIVNLSMSSPGGSRSGSAEKLCKVTDFSGTAKTFRKFFSSPPRRPDAGGSGNARGGAPRRPPPPASFPKASAKLPLPPKTAKSLREKVYNLTHVNEQRALLRCCNGLQLASRHRFNKKFRLAVKKTFQSNRLVISLLSSTMRKRAEKNAIFFTTAGTFRVTACFNST